MKNIIGTIIAVILVIIAVIGDIQMVKETQKEKILILEQKNLVDFNSSVDNNNIFNINSRI